VVTRLSAGIPVLAFRRSLFTSPTGAARTEIASSAPMGFAPAADPPSGGTGAVNIGIVGIGGFVPEIRRAVFLVRA